MTKHVSPYFLTIYENWIKDSESNLTEKKGLIDTIYHEQEFKKWLINEYEIALTETSYKELCSSANFDKYLPAEKKINTKWHRIVKRKKILEILKHENLIPTVKEEYDVDIVGSFFMIKELLQKYDIEKSKSELFLQSIKWPIVDYCKKNALPIATVFDMKYAIVVDSSVYNYEIYLARTLMAFDVIKISALLDHQMAMWKGKELFPIIVEHAVYNYIKKNSLFDNSLRLSNIMDWVEKRRRFMPPDWNEEFYYWPYDLESLSKLYLALLKARNIEEHNEFINVFKIAKNLQTNQIVWEGSKRQLMILLYLIYKKINLYKDMSLPYIAIKLFKNSDNNFNLKSLSTILNQVIPMLNDRKKLSPSLVAIVTIFEDLNLN